MNEIDPDPSKCVPSDRCAVSFSRSFTEPAVSLGVVEMFGEAGLTVTRSDSSLFSEAELLLPSPVYVAFH